MLIAAVVLFVVVVRMRLYLYTVDSGLRGGSREAHLKVSFPILPEVFSPNKGTARRSHTVTGSAGSSSGRWSR